MRVQDTPEAQAIRESLLAWQEAGVEDPIMPVYTDVNGDGIPDYYGLRDGELVYVTDRAEGTDVSVVFGTTGEEGP